ncbi:MAG: adenylate/guanylate cyclase domain-containing protein [Hyphomicrobiales bacterium]|nr:adenylate/guanylate cyclase domain-containing protein [Hyphomicrobiales bacterium]MCP5002112.1 adenylate/guanylate cyclase domain-containing protein [Hyphomicrobiales bacterium]
MGIHTGSVVAGVIGKRKFSYDIWGDAVNLAARLEAAGPPDEILVSKTTRRLLQDKYVFDEFGTIQVKGIGEQQVFILRSRA